MKKINKDDVDGVSQNLVSKIESFVLDWMNDNTVPGVSFALVDGDEIIYTDGFGARNLETNAPATSNTIYGLGSATKPVTATAILQLLEREKLTLDDDLSDYLPVFEDLSGDPITIEQLLTHTSGMPSDGAAITLVTRAEIGAGPEVPLSSRSDFYRHVDGATECRVTDRRDEFLYYNSGFVLLGHLIEEITGRKYTDYVANEILEPLGMERSTFTQAAFENKEDTMQPYYSDGDNIKQGRTVFDENISPAGGLFGSVTDIATFVSNTITCPDQCSIPNIDTDVITEMQQPQAVMTTRLDGTETRYGYGWMRQPLTDRTLVGHGGASATSSFGYWGEQNGTLGVAIGCNKAPRISSRYVGEAIISIARGHAPSQTVLPFMLEKKV